MTVREMLERITAREMSKWQAYENVNGRLDSQWTSEQFSEINELLQSMLYTYIQINSKPGAAEDSKPVTVIRPWNLHEEYKRRSARGELDV
jgi:hypothetical protein